MSGVATWQPGALYLKGAVVRPTSKPAPVPAVLANADFESGDSDWTKGAGFSITTGSPFSGTYSAKYAASPHTSAFIESSAYIAVQPGETVAASCMVKQGASSSGDAGGSVWIRWYDASHTLLSGSQGNVISSGSNGEWKRSSVSANAPGSAAYFRVAGECYLKGSGQPLWLDKFTLSYTPRATTGAGLIFRATQDDPGTSAATEPVWPDAVGETVVDNTVTWEGVGDGFVTWEAHALMVSGADEPSWPTSEGAVVADGTLEWEAISTRITDENCPNTKVVAIASSKVFAVDRDVVRFCATANPLDWTTEQDAGYLPTGLQQANANDMAVLQIYRGNLAAWNANCFQMWQVDPDPAQMAILDQMDGIGSTQQRAAQGVANDLLFLSQLGVRSVGIANAAENLAAGDVGSPIDVLVRSAMAADGARALGTYYPGAGQYWLAMAGSTPYEMTIEGNLGDGGVGGTGFYQYTIKGGTAPVTCAISAGALPPGATMDSAGLVTFDYTTEGEYSWTVTATDADGNIAHVDDANLVSGLACGVESEYTGGETYPTTFNILLGSQKGEVTVEWGFGVPDKVEIWIGGILRFSSGYQGVGVGHTYSQDQDALDAALDTEGEPRQTLIYPETSPGTFYKNSADVFAEARVYGPIAGTSWTFKLGCPDIFAEPGALAISGVNRKPKVGYTKDYAYATHGGEEPYAFTVQSGALPTGRSIDPDTGVETGTYSAAGTFDFTVRVTDNLGATADFTDSVTVVASF